ncbi:hypothetical protein RIF29_20308 [Crotalaria pallida]|uniref:Uncharacterized protein n=1 Tax=Crotalaria pallida TaxID=3830 RepID=A0AAN9F5D3_CROPI
MKEESRGGTNQRVMASGSRSFSMGRRPRHQVVDDLRRRHLLRLLLRLPRIQLLLLLIRLLLPLVLCVGVRVGVVAWVRVERIG